MIQVRDVSTRLSMITTISELSQSLSRSPFTIYQRIVLMLDTHPSHDGVHDRMLALQLNFGFLLLSQSSPELYSLESWWSSLSWTWETGFSHFKMFSWARTTSGTSYRSLCIRLVLINKVRLPTLTTERISTEYWVRWLIFCDWSQERCFFSEFSMIVHNRTKRSPIQLLRMITLGRESYGIITPSFAARVGSVARGIRVVTYTIDRGIKYQRPWKINKHHIDILTLIKLVIVIFNLSRILCWILYSNNNSRTNQFQPTKSRSVA